MKIKIYKSQSGTYFSELADCKIDNLCFNLAAATSHECTKLYLKELYNDFSILQKYTRTSDKNIKKLDNERGENMYDKYGWRIDYFDDEFKMKKVLNFIHAALLYVNGKDYSTQKEFCSNSKGANNVVPHWIVEIIPGIHNGNKYGICVYDVVKNIVEKIVMLIEDGTVMININPSKSKTAVYREENLESYGMKDEDLEHKIKRRLHLHVENNIRDNLIKVLV